jgi:hypothetical protein
MLLPSIKVGDAFKTNKSGSCIVIEYINAHNVRVRFEDGAETTCEAGALRNGYVKYPSLKFYGIGFIGIGNYSCTSHLRIYNCWLAMLRRCYSEFTQKKQLTYKDCTVCERWLCFQNFAHDYLLMFGSDLNYQLDKDWLIKGNKIYSPETCRLVPQEVNNFLEKSNASRGECCIGVNYYEGTSTPYRASCRIKGKQEHLGYFKTQQEAYLAYKAAKEAEAKRLANVFKDTIDPDILSAMINYKVDIND